MLINKLKFVIIIVLLLLVGCSTEKKKDKMDLETIKENREGLDYRPEADGIFEKLDTLLIKWNDAYKNKIRHQIRAVENDLYELVRGNFSLIIKTLEESDNSKKIIASAALGFCSDVRAIPYLIKGLDDPNSTVRTNSAMSIGHIGSDQTPTESLIKKLQTEQDDSVRGMISFAISRIVRKDDDQGTLPYLLKAINDKNSAVRNHVVLSLRKIQSEEGKKAILRVTLDDKVAIVRYNSILALADMGGDDIVVPLIKRLRDSQNFVKIAAYRVLKRLTGKDFKINPKEWEEWQGISTGK